MSSLAETGVGRLALRGACAGLRMMFHRARFPRLQLWMWDRVVRPHILWRSFPIEARTRFGARFEGGFPDAVHSAVYFFGVWEPAVTRLYHDALRPGDIVIDVGANVGLHTLLAARLVGATGRVHAIEASPWIFARLLRNLAANRAANVRAYNMAATAVAGPVSVYLHDETNLGGTTIIAAELDPLLSEGKLLADQLTAAGVRVNYQLYPGTTHEFFGMAAAVPQARAAQSVAFGDVKAGL